MKDLVSAFNAGKEIEASEGGQGGYTSTVVQVTDAKLMVGDNNHENSYLHNPQETYLQLSFKTKEGVTFEAYQKLKINDGKVTNYAYPRFEGTNGTAPASLCHDVLSKAKEFDIDQDRSAIGFGPNKFKGLKFNLSYKEVTRKDGSGTAIIPLFDRQLLKDEGYLAANPKEVDNSQEVESVIKPDELPF